MLAENITRGAQNLLLNCAGLASGDRLLIVVEEAFPHYYDPALATAISTAAFQLGILVETHKVPFIAQVTEPDQALQDAMAKADRTLFLARIGDQLRFSETLAQGRPVVSYVFDTEMLGSSYGTAHHRGFTELKDRFNAAFAKARRIRVTCPLGTDFEGPGTGLPDAAPDVSVARFPMTVFTPIPAAGFRGQIAQAGFLTGTGSNYYTPYTVALDGILVAHFDKGRITGFSGSPADVARAKAHYADVAQQLGIDRDFVHSWHAGMHPGCSYRQQAARSPERWAGAAFGNPRVLHVHTCGSYAPGEISLNIIDPTVTLDGVSVWEDGRLYPQRISGGAELLAKYPCAASAFANPARNIGLSSAGQLSSVVESAPVEPHVDPFSRGRVRV